MITSSSRRRRRRWRAGKFPPSWRRGAFRTAVTPAPFRRDANHCYSRLHRKLDYGHPLVLPRADADVDDEDGAVVALCFLAEAEDFSVLAHLPGRPYLTPDPRQIARHTRVRALVVLGIRPPSAARSSSYAYRCTARSVATSELHDCKANVENSPPSAILAT